MEKTIFYNINGGYGRCICATGVLMELKKRNPNIKINVVTNHQEIFINNPSINKVYSLNHEYIFEDHINGFDYIEPEPYKLQDYISGKMHLINGFSLEILKENSFYQPNLFINEREIEEAKAFIKQTNKKIILFQPFGQMGGQTLDGKKVMKDSSYRSLPYEFAKKIHDRLTAEGYQVVCIKASNQAGIDGGITFPPNITLRKISALIPYVSGVICIDSSLQHICKCLNKKAIVLWGSTNFKQLGYDTHINLGNLNNKIQYNPVRVPGNDYDFEKRYEHVWDYLNDALIDKIIEEIK